MLLDHSLHIVCLEGQEEELAGDLGDLAPVLPDLPDPQEDE